MNNNQGDFPGPSFLQPKDLEELKEYDGPLNVLETLDPSLLPKSTWNKILKKNSRTKPFLIVKKTNIIDHSKKNANGRIISVEELKERRLYADESTILPELPRPHIVSLTGSFPADNNRDLMYRTELKGKDQKINNLPLSNARRTRIHFVEDRPLALFVGNQTDDGNVIRDSWLQPIRKRISTFKKSSLLQTLDLNDAFEKSYAASRWNLPQKENSAMNRPQSVLGYMELQKPATVDLALALEIQGKRSESVSENSKSVRYSSPWRAHNTKVIFELGVPEDDEVKVPFEESEQVGAKRDERRTEGLSRSSNHQRAYSYDQYPTIAHRGDSADSLDTRLYDVFMTREIQGSPTTLQKDTHTFKGLMNMAPLPMPDEFFSDSPVIVKLDRQINDQKNISAGLTMKQSKTENFKSHEEERRSIFTTHSGVPDFYPSFPIQRRNQEAGNESVPSAPKRSFQISEAFLKVHFEKSLIGQSFVITFPEDTLLLQTGFDPKIDLAYENARLGKMEEAKRMVDECIVKGECMEISYWARHQMNLLLGSPELALKDLEKIIETNPDNLDAILTRARIYKFLGRYEDALHDIDTTLTRVPNSEVSLLEKAEIYKSQGNQNLSARTLENILDISVNKTPILRNLLYYWQERKNWNQCLTIFDQIIGISDLNPSDHFDRANVHCTLGNWSEAYSDYTSTLKINPSHIDAYYKRAILTHHSHTERAIDDLTLCIWINTLRKETARKEYFLLRGNCYLKLRNYQNAIDDLEKVVQMDEDCSEALWNLALLHYKKTRNIKIACNHIKKYLLKVKTNPNAYVLRFHLIMDQFEKHEGNASYLIDSAYRDINCALHLKPWKTDYYLKRARLHHIKRNFTLLRDDLADYQRLLKNGDENLHRRLLVMMINKDFSGCLGTYKNATNGLTDIKENLKILAVKAALNLDRLDETLELIKSLADSQTEKCLLTALLFYKLGYYPRVLDNIYIYLKRNSKNPIAYLYLGLAKFKSGANGLKDLDRVSLSHEPVYQYLSALNQAIFFEYRGNSDQSMRHLNSALRVYPKNPRTLLLKAVSLYKQQEYLLASQDFDRVIAILPGHTLSIMLRGACYHHMAKYQQAIKDYSVLILMDCFVEIAFRNRCLCYWTLGKYQPAIADLESYRLISPQDVNGLKFLAFAYQEVGKAKDAIEVYSKALKLVPDDQTILYHRATVYYKIGDYDQAINDLTTVVENRKTWTSPYLLLAEIHQHFGEARKALISLEKGLRHCPNSAEIRSAKALILATQAKFQEALNEIDSAIKIDPSNAELYANRAALKQRSAKEVYTVVNDYKKCLDIDPDNPSALFNLANIYLASEQFEFTLRLLDRFLLKNEDGYAYLARGLAKSRLRKNREAEDDFARAENFLGESFHIVMARAEMYEIAGDYMKARACYEKAMKLIPERKSGLEMKLAELELRHDLDKQITYDAKKKLMKK